MHASHRGNYFNYSGNKNISTAIRTHFTNKANMKYNV